LGALISIRRARTVFVGGTAADVVVGALGRHLIETVATGAKVLDAAGVASDPRPPKQAVLFRPVRLD